MRLGRAIARAMRPTLNVTSYTDTHSGAVIVFVSCRKGYLSADGGWVEDFNRVHDFGTVESASTWCETSGYKVKLLRQ